VSRFATSNGWPGPQPATHNRITAIRTSATVVFMVHPFKKARWFVIRIAQFGWGGANGSVWWLYIQSLLIFVFAEAELFGAFSVQFKQSCFQFQAVLGNFVGSCVFRDFHWFCKGQVDSSEGFDDYEFIPAFQLPLACRLIADRYDFGAGQLREFDDAFVHFEGGASGTIGCYREIVPCGDPFSELSNCLGTASARRTSYCVLLELSDEGDAVIAVLAHAYEYGDLRFFNGFCIIIYEVEEAAVPEGEDASAPVGVFFEDVQSGGGELVQAAGALLEEVEKESKEFCKEFMHNPGELGAARQLFVFTPSWGLNKHLIQSS